MYIISLPGRKGGTGKSTLAKMLCIGATEQKKKAVLVRLEGTVKFDDLPYELLDVTEEYGMNQNDRWIEVNNELAEREDKIDLCVFDSAANAINYDLASIEKSDLCLIPTTLDQQSFEYARKSINAAREAGAMVFIVPNQCDRRSHSEVEELMDNFSRHEILHQPDGRLFRLPRLKPIQRMNTKTPLKAHEKRTISEVSRELYDAIEYSMKKFSGGEA